MRTSNFRNGMPALTEKPKRGPVVCVPRAATTPPTDLLTTAVRVACSSKPIANARNFSVVIARVNQLPRAESDGDRPVSSTTQVQCCRHPRLPPSAVVRRPDAKGRPPTGVRLHFLPLPWPILSIISGPLFPVLLFFLPGENKKSAVRSVRTFSSHRGLPALRSGSSLGCSSTARGRHPHLHHGPKCRKGHDGLSKISPSSTGRGKNEGTKTLSCLGMY